MITKQGIILRRINEPLVLNNRQLLSLHPAVRRNTSAHNAVGNPNNENLSALTEDKTQSPEVTSSWRLCLKQHKIYNFIKGNEI
jgi:hypothetical protein